MALFLIIAIKVLLFILLHVWMCWILCGLVNGLWEFADSRYAGPRYCCWGNTFKRELDYVGVYVTYMVEIDFCVVDWNLKF